LTALAPDRLQALLIALQGKLNEKAEDAYRDRDAANALGHAHAQSYASGLAHAYGDAADAVREAQEEYEAAKVETVAPV
jgi:hypothetical protein